MRESHRCVKDIRGTGYFYAIELTADRGTGHELTELLSGIDGMFTDVEAAVPV